MWGVAALEILIVGWVYYIIPLLVTFKRVQWKVYHLLR